jgi:Xaa-Pro aminopeptidase
MDSSLKRLQQAVKKENLDGLLISEITNIRYLTGFSGSAAKLLVTPTKSYFFSDFRYKDQSAKEVNGAKVIIGQRDPVTDFPNFAPLTKKNLKLGYQSEYISYSVLEQLKELLPNALMVATKGMVDALTIIKTQEEISYIKEAVKISDEAFKRILGYIQPGLKEIEIAAELEYQMKMLGSEKPAFDSIIASGWRGALPHGIASEKKVEKGEMITLDFGAVYKGYHSDITRTIVVGKANVRQKKIYNLVLKAQTAGCKTIKAGIVAKNLDKKVRDIISKAGYGKYFGHGLGHGLGTVVHDTPFVSTISDTILKSNMVVTIEPGIYIPQWGGVRIEDDVVIKKNKSVILNKAPKELIEL